MTCSQCTYHWCWGCGQDISKVYGHYPTFLLYFACDVIMFAPKTKCQFLIYIFLFFLMLALIPVINFFAVGGLVLMFLFDRMNWHTALINPKRSGCLLEATLFLVFLPWNTAIISVAVIIAAIPATIALPFIILPSYYQNIESYFSIMKYWWKGNRFEAEVEEE